MRKLVLALALAIAATVGCKHGGSAKLEGHWRGVRADGAPSATQDAANAFATQTEITAHGDKITVTTPQSKGQPAVYVVDDENKTTVILHTDKDGADKKETFTFNDDKTMTWRLGEGRTIVFQKLKD